MGTQHYMVSQQTSDIEPMLIQCWASVVDQSWVNVSCLPGVDGSTRDLLVIATNTQAETLIIQMIE